MPCLPNQNNLGFACIVQKRAYFRNKNGHFVKKSKKQVIDLQVFISIGIIFSTIACNKNKCCANNIVPCIT